VVVQPVCEVLWFGAERLICEIISRASNKVFHGPDAAEPHGSNFCLYVCLLSDVY
jgi:hypothetical protein